MVSKILLILFVLYVLNRIIIQDTYRIDIDLVV